MNETLKDKINKFVELKQDILNESKSWHGDKKDCPLNKCIEIDHDDFSNILLGAGMICWDCPFCNEHFES